MSPDKPEITADIKKKATIALVALVVIVIAWQIKGLMSSDVPASAAATPAPAAMPQGKTVANGAPVAGTPGAAAAPVDTAPKQVPVQANMELLKLQKETEAKYIAALNELQMLKLQRDIAEVNQAIAKAKLDTMGTEKNITDLLTVKPPPPPTQLPDSEYAKMIAEGTDSTSLKPPGQSAGGAPKSPNEEVTTVAPGTAVYTVLSVSKQNSKWSAVLGSNGKLFNVNVGDTISLDGTIVSSISRDGVILEQKGVKKTVSISTAL